MFAACTSIDTYSAIGTTDGIIRPFDTCTATTENANLAYCGSAILVLRTAGCSFMSPWSASLNPTALDHTMIKRLTSILDDYQPFVLLVALIFGVMGS